MTLRMDERTETTLCEGRSTRTKAGRDVGNRRLGEKSAKCSKSRHLMDSDDIDVETKKLDNWKRVERSLQAVGNLNGRAGLADILLGRKHSGVVGQAFIFLLSREGEG
jgi:hypothetical protein